MINNDNHHTLISQVLLGSMTLSHSTFLHSHLLMCYLKKRIPSNQDSNTKGFQRPLGKRLALKALPYQCREGMG